MLETRNSAIIRQPTRLCISQTCFQEVKRVEHANSVSSGLRRCERRSHTYVKRRAQSTLERYAARAEAVFNRVPHYSATKTSSLSSLPRGETSCVRIALCTLGGRSDWFGLLRAEIADVCELRRWEQASAVCAAG
jgi:hypothetical protein